ncbi:hypothetical protein COV81_03815 [Candidatus Peregrinibacteria bacterium CG11_big_fil_rev_8_21_14_0_20_41_10]|nr:MAG: hypothetical protein COV81_03815 [Candidatus Peregrinibacteria bacterium CG11_big_fil_rev_8_21_14_0_20_41_10]PIZ74273.1 MAG: hypothetical protein COY06_04520 [Candidatus Peregrinibacteria bacterium CG_4_10_14_0_2_um_filter_41_8]PJC38248.1 MAG: hypothetical protein CO045_01345 [Candidatus Peregrinibacteria bacterium CG_4_9_14_0_2_um_filter_41_14]
MKILINWLLSALAVFGAAYLLPGVSLGDFWTALVVALVLGIINAIIRPILVILTLPINILTLGLFTIVINGVLVMFADSLVDGFAVTSFLSAILFSIIMGLINWLLSIFR